MRKSGPDKETIREILGRDKIIKDLIERFGIPEGEPGTDIFNDLIRSIVGQQLSIKAAETIYGRFLQLFPSEPDPTSLIAVETEQLRSAGLSGQKSSYVKNVALFFRDNKLIEQNWDTMSDDEILELLTKIKGVGVWTVQMLLMFSFNRLDVFPIGDLGIRQGMKEIYGLESEGKELEKELISIAANWSPYRSVASKLIWKAKDQK